MANQLGRLGIGIVGVAAAVLVGCTEVPTEETRVVPSRSDGLPIQQPDVDTRSPEFPSKPRIDMRLSASGGYRPGQAFTVRLEGLALANAASAEIQLQVPDDGTPAAPDVAPEPKLIRQWTGSLGPGGSVELSEPIVFEHPGYYRVSAVLRNMPNQGEPWRVGDTALLDGVQRHLWIVVDSSGGRLTAEYDTTAVPDGYRPLFGAYGPFVPTQLQEAGDGGAGLRGAGATALPGRLRAPGGSNRLLYSQYAQGTLKYRNYDVSGGPYEPVPGAKLKAHCYGKSNPMLLFYDLYNYVETTTAPDGSWTLDCGSQYEYAHGTFVFESTYANVAGVAGAAAGAWFTSYGGTHNLTVANDYAARVFMDLTERIPAVFTLWGATKSAVTAWVSADDDDYGINWCTTGFSGCPGVDVIRTNFERIYRQNIVFQPDDGLFVTVHEYGHGFHYYGIEDWATGAGACSNNEHFWDEDENLGCAFVEGMADVISMMAIGPSVATTPYAGDHGMENNLYNSNPTNPPPSGDGVRVESAVAAFLYDILDGNSELDGPTNGTGAPEAHDSLTAAGVHVTNRLKWCRLDGTITKLSGADQVVYCLEGDAGAYTPASGLSGAWRAYSTVTYDNTPGGSIDANQVRKLWKYNFYGIP